jgi:hypothetical protein
MVPSPVFSNQPLVGFAATQACGPFDVANPERQMAAGAFCVHRATFPK